MLIYGTCNPDGLDNIHNGKTVYLTSDDIDKMARNMTGVPVRVEHHQENLGTVRHAWVYQNKLDVLVDVDEKMFYGSLAGASVKGNKLREFSLGYTVELNHSTAAPYGDKRIVEVSLVKKGARDGCHIKMFD